MGRIHVCALPTVDDLVRRSVVSETLSCAAVKVFRSFIDGVIVSGIVAIG